MKNRVIQNIVNEIRPRMETKLEEELSPNEELEHLCEMAVHCKSEDQLGMEIVVGGTPWWEKNKSGSNHKEHNPPHAHILWKGKKNYLYSRFQIANPNPPQTIEELQTVNDKDIPLDSIADKLLDWVNQKPKRAFSEGDKTNWDAMRGTWMDIQDYVNEGLSKPVILQTREEYEREESL